jgi:hypothetical protein
MKSLDPNRYDEYLTDYDYIASAFADAYLSGVNPEIIWQAFLLSSDAKEFYEALDASVKLHDLINNQKV